MSEKENNLSDYKSQMEDISPDKNGGVYKRVLKTGFG
jgi:hypothetical protein